LKTLLRSARALIGLDKLPEALDALERLRIAEGGGEDSGNKWREEVEGKMRRKKEKELERVEKLRRTNETNEALQQALKVRLSFPAQTNFVFPVLQKNSFLIDFFMFSPSEYLASRSHLPSTDFKDSPLPLLPDLVVRGGDEVRFTADDQA